MSQTADVLVVGGGIAGVSIAAELAADHSVILAETEAMLAHHTTGRSAALFIESYGHPLVRELTRASRATLTDPPPELVDGPLCQPRGMMFVATDDRRAGIDEMIAEQPALARLTRDDLVSMVPALQGGNLAHGAYEEVALDIDVSGLHQLYVRQLRKRGGTIALSSPVREIRPAAAGAGWTARLGAEPVSVGTVVNAAGAWGDEVAQDAGVKPVGLMPKRRTAFTTPFVKWKESHPDHRTPWPMVVEVDEAFYFRTEGEDQLLCSPADEIPSDPCDSKAEEIDVARAIDEINSATDLDIRTVATAWGGLRTFAPDRLPVFGPDDAAEDFFWFVGQGGTGIQTAPGAAALAGRIARGQEPAGPLGVERLRA